MRRIFRLLTGFFRVTISTPHPERILNITLKKNIPIWDLVCREASLSFSLAPWHRKFFLSQCPLSSGEKMDILPGGILLLWRPFHKRLGLFLGLAIFFLSLYLSTLFIWSVEVDGNVTLSENQIVAMAAQAGLSPGVPIHRVDPAAFALHFQVENPHFAFVSLNVIGTRAHLSVRERVQVEEIPKTSDVPRNLIASINGTIQRYEVLAGQVAVHRGETVRKGDLLIGGVVERTNGAFSLVCAEGRVFAETERYAEFSVPFATRQSIFTGREEEKRRYEILGFSLASPGFDADPFSDFALTEQREYITFLGRRLPIVCHRRTWHEKTDKNSILTVDRAKNMAYDKYEEYKRENLSPGYQILSEEFELRQDNEGICLCVTLRLSENIASPAPFSLADPPADQES